MSVAAPPTSLLDKYEGTEFFPLYTTAVTIGGGEARHARASGRAVSDDGALDVTLRVPKALGGMGGGTNPEQLFAAGYGACFHGALSLIAGGRKIKLPADITIEVSVTFGRDPDDGLFQLVADVAVTMPGVDDAVADELIAAAEEACPYAKMARKGIRSTIRRL